MPRRRSAAERRLAAAAGRGGARRRARRRLWTAIAEATGAHGNTTALVGTPETVAEALLDYVDIGVTTLLIRGYDPFDDAVDYGDVVRAVRAEVAARDDAHADRSEGPMSGPLLVVLGSATPPGRFRRALAEAVGERRRPGSRHG